MSDLQNVWQSMADNPSVQTIGWLLVHSVWQFVAIALVAFLLMQLLRQRSAMLRYRILLIAMSLFVVMPILTAIWTPVQATTAVPENRPVNVNLLNKTVESLAEYDAGSVTSENRTPSESPNDQILDSLEQDSLESVSIASAKTSGIEEPAKADSISLAGTTTTIQPYLPTIVTVWLIGMLLFAIRPLVGWHTVFQIRRTGTAVPATIQQAFESTVRRLNVSGGVSVLQSTIVTVPIVVGYLKPVVLLPVSVVTGLPMNQIEAILAHELAHVKRRDYLVNVAQALVETIFFYHPAVWWLSNRIRIEREHCCDDDVVAALDNRSDYGKALLALTQLQPNSSLLALSGGGGKLLTRIRRLCGVEPARRSWTGILASVCVVFVGLSVIGLGALNFGWAAMTENDDKDDTGKFDTVTVKLIENDSQRRTDFRIDVPFQGYPGKNKQHRTIQQQENRTFALDKFESGKHTLMATDNGAQGFWKRFFQIELPSKKQQIDIPLVDSKSRSFGSKLNIGEVTVRHKDFDIRTSFNVKIKNNSGKPWPIGDLSRGEVELVGNDYRVFVPKGLLKDPGAIQPGREYALTVDWWSLVENGLWISREAEVKKEPELPDDESYLGFRVKLWGATTKKFQLLRPELVLAELAAMKKVTTHIRFAKETFTRDEPVAMHLVVKNKGDRDIGVTWGGDSRSVRRLRYKIVATKDGKPVPDPHQIKTCFGGKGGTTTIKPGDEYEMYELDLREYCTINRPGTYEVRAYHDLGWEAQYNGPVPLLENRLPKVPTLAKIATAKLIVTKDEIKPVEAREIDDQADQAGIQPLDALSISSVETWQQLLDQKPIPLKNGTARLGIDSSNPRANGVVTLFCLTDGYSPPTLWNSDDCLGPFTVENIDLSGQQQIQKMQSLEQTSSGKDRPNGKLLFRKTISVHKTGPFQIQIRDKAKKIVASQRFDAQQDEPHPWMAFADVRRENLQTDEQADPVVRLASRAGYVVPTLNGRTALLFQQPGQKPRFAPSEKLPSLQTQHESLRLVQVDGKIQIEMPRPLTLNSLHERLLVRWLVNGKPAQSGKQHQERMQTRSAQKVIVGRKLLLDLSFDPRDLRAKPTDKIEMQLMYCKNGWESVGQDLKRLQVIADDDAPDVLLSNVITLNRPKPFERLDAIFGNRSANQDKSGEPEKNANRKQIGMVLGKPVFESQIAKNDLSDTLHYVLVRPLYADLVRKMPKLDPGPLVKQRISDPKKQDRAIRTLTNWNVQKYIYEKYGKGRLGFGMLGLIALDAEKKWFEEREQQGDVKIDDPAMRAKLFEFWTKDAGSRATSDPNHIAELFDPSYAKNVLSRMSVFTVPNPIVRQVHQLAAKALSKPGDIKDRRPAGLEDVESPEQIQSAVQLAIDDLSRLSNPRSDQKSDPRVRLRYLGEFAFEALVKALDSDNETIVLQTCHLLGKHGQRAVGPLLKVLLDHPNKQLRAAAASGLGQTYHPNAVLPLIKALKDKEETVRIAASSALGFLRDRRALEPLKSCFEDPNGHIARNAHKNILLPKNEGYAFWPAEMLDIRALTIDALTLKGESFGDQQLSRLVDHLDSESGTVSSACMLTLSELKYLKCVPKIISRPTSRSRAHALARMPTPAAIDALIRDINSGSATPRETETPAKTSFSKESAIAGLGGSAGRWAAPLLIALLDDSQLRRPAEENSSDSFLEKWPESHLAHIHLSSFFTNHGLKSESRNLARGETNDVPAEIMNLKAWWKKHGDAFLAGRDVPNPKLSMLWYND